MDHKNKFQKTQLLGSQMDYIWLFTKLFDRVEKQLTDLCLQYEVNSELKKRVQVIKSTNKVLAKIA